MTHTHVVKTQIINYQSCISLPIPALPNSNSSLLHFGETLSPLLLQLLTEVTVKGLLLPGRSYRLLSLYRCAAVFEEAEIAQLAELGDKRGNKYLSYCSFQAKLLHWVFVSAITRGGCKAMSNHGKVLLAKPFLQAVQHSNCIGRRGGRTIKTILAMSSSLWASSPHVVSSWTTAPVPLTEDLSEASVTISWCDFLNEVWPSGIPCHLTGEG